MWLVNCVWQCTCYSAVSLCVRIKTLVNRTCHCKQCSPLNLKLHVLQLAVFSTMMYMNLDIVTTRCYFYVSQVFTCYLLVCCLATCENENKRRQDLPLHTAQFVEFEITCIIAGCLFHYEVFEHKYCYNPILLCYLHFPLRSALLVGGRPRLVILWKYKMNVLS